MSSRIFPAKYGGRCAADCGERIEPGDDVTFVDDELVHAYPCAEADEESNRRIAARTTGRFQAACASCHLVHAGECL